MTILSYLKVLEMLVIGHPGMEAGEKKLRELFDVVPFKQAGN